VASYQSISAALGADDLMTNEKVNRKLFILTFSIKEFLEVAKNTRV
jgi:hypothetical protein